VIIASAQAQFDNLGDVIIRRNFIHWLAEMDEVLTLVGAAPPSYVEALMLPANAIPFTSLRDAARILGLGRLRGSSMAFAPGEHSLVTQPSLVAKAVANLLLTGAVRAGGGRVVKIGRGYRGEGQALRVLERLQVALSNGTWVRDTEAVGIFPRASLMPDIALASDLLDPRRRVDEGETWPGERMSVSVSLRNDRSSRAEDFVDATALIVERTGLAPVVVSQVRRDEPTSSSLAESLGGRHVEWKGSYVEQLERVARAYATSQFVVSDRLHVLLFALLRGAVPVGLETGKDRKLSRQLGGLGLGGLVTESGNWKELVSRVSDDPAAALETSRRSLRGATERLDAVKEEVRRALRAG
jgi:hypothetical protein